MASPEETVQSSDEPTPLEPTLTGPKPSLEKIAENEGEVEEKVLTDKMDAGTEKESEKKADEAEPMPPSILKQPGESETDTNISKEPSAVTFSQSARKIDSPGKQRSPRPKLSKALSKHIDIVTGQVTKRTQSVRVIDGESNVARDRSKWKRVRSLVGIKDEIGEDDVDQATSSPYVKQSKKDADIEYGGSVKKKADPRHYRIRSQRSSAQNIADFFENRWLVVLLTEYLRWTFQAPFSLVFLSILCAFLILIIVFALLIFLYAHFRPECISTTDFKIDNLGDTFVDAYQLSWTTLATVGYGIIGPQNAYAGGETHYRCIGVNSMMAFESFVGVLFGGVTGAIIFGKVARIQSIANVLWSDCIVVKYGTGVMTAQLLDDDKDAMHATSNDADEKIQLPCPILEFRLINELSRVPGGEIMNATVNVVASTLLETDEDVAPDEEGHFQNKKGSLLASLASKSKAATAKVASNTGKVASKAGKAVKHVGEATAKKASNTVKAAANLRASTKAAADTEGSLLATKRRELELKGSVIQKLQARIQNTPNHEDLINEAMANDPQAPEVEPYNSANGIGMERAMEKMLENRFIKKMTEIAEKTRKASVAVDEGDAKLAPPRVFHKLEIETDTHPFFKRSWHIRHELNASSPLLTKKARRAIEENGGFWPEEWNDHESVREHLRFSQIIVSFSGTANVSGCAVYAQKVYDFDVVNIGYTFAPILVISKDTMVVDDFLLNDVREQQGGGGEPIFTTTTNDFGEFAMGAVNGLYDKGMAVGTGLKETIQVVAGRQGVDAAA